MAIDTLIAYVGVYDSVEDAEADYQLVKDLHTKADLIDAYDAAVVERRGGKTKIVKKHETPTRVGGVLGGGVGLATGLVVALFPFAAVGGGLLAGTAAGGAILGAVAGHAAAGMSRDDLKQLGEHLDAGQAGLVVVAVSDMGAKVERAMERATKLEQKQLEADADEIERDASAAASQPARRKREAGDSHAIEDLPGEHRSASSCMASSSTDVTSDPLAVRTPAMSSDPHEHQHGPGCGHTAIRHDDHIDHLHDGELHHHDETGVERHALAISDSNPADCTPAHACAEHDADHEPDRTAAMRRPPQRAH